MTDAQVATSLNLRGKTITTFILYEVNHALQELDERDRLEVVTDAFPAIDPDIAAWCRATGNRLVDVTADGESRRYVIEKGAPRISGHKLAEKVTQLQELGAQLYACGPSMQHYKVNPADVAFDNVIICEYLTFIEQMHDADIHLYV